MRLLIAFTLSTLSLLGSCHEAPSSRDFDFEGKYRWNHNILDLCDHTETISFEPRGPGHLCYVYRILLFFVKVEVVSTRLPAVVYHQFLPQSLVDRFLKLVDHVSVQPLTVQAKPDKEGQRMEDSRIANGTFLDHHGYPETTEMFAYIQTRINAFNFKFAEMFQVLAYVSGGHYAPHYDYFLQNWDVEELGNRIATFMPVLKTAEKGGGTVFPNANLIFAPQPGDAILWFNAKPSGQRVEGSLHGACPIIKGTKVGLTLWIREKGNELRMPCPGEEGVPYSLERIVKPRWQRRDKAALIGGYLDSVETGSTLFG